LQTNAHRTADPTQRDAFHEPPRNEAALLLRDHVIFWMQEKGPATPLAAVILFAGMNMAVSLEPW
jgi:hypothetical protein